MQKQHHYIPRFYLEHFVDKSREHGKNPYLWVLEKGKLKPFNTSPKNAAKRSRYYSSGSSAGADSLVFENMFAKIEGEVAPVIKCMHPEKHELSGEEKGLLAVFIALMHVRVPQWREMVEHVCELQFRAMMDIMTVNEERAAHMIISNCEKRTGQKTGIQPKDMIHMWRSGQLKPKANPQYALAISLQAVYIIPAIMGNMRWRFLLPGDSKRLFITSDNPVTIRDPNANSGDLMAHGLISPGVEITFPLRPDLLLLASYKGNDGIVKVPFKKVRDLNKRTAENAMRYVFSDKAYSYIQGMTAGMTPRKKEDCVRTIRESDDSIITEFRPQGFPPPDRPDQQKRDK